MESSIKLNISNSYTTSILGRSYYVQAVLLNSSCPTVKLYK